MRIIAPIFVALGVAMPVSIGVIYAIDAWERPEPVREQPVTGSPNLVPGIRLPPTVPARVAKIADDEIVIGVDVNGKARAYRLSALAPMMSHVVNDVIDGDPVTVTYCDRTECTRVFTGEGDEPLEVGTGGFMEQLFLRVDGKFFWQHTVKYLDPNEPSTPPLSVLPHTRTTWKAWREAHPDTDVFLGVDQGTAMKVQ